MKCQWHKFLYNFLPFTRLKALIIQKHINNCDHCRKDIPNDNELRTIFAAPAWVLEEKDMWPEIKNKLNSDPLSKQSKPKKTNLFFPAWGWAAAVLFICTAAGILYITSHNTNRETISPAAGSPGVIVKVKYGEVKGEKANYHIYQAEDKYYILFLKSQDSGG